MRRFPEFVRNLHHAHLSNVLWATAHLPVERMCLDASNSLLVRRGLRAYIAAMGDADALRREPIQGWCWGPEVARGNVERCFPAICHGQHEGTVYRAAVLAELARRVEQFEVAWPREDALADHPGEEVLLPCAHLQLAPAMVVHEPYVWMRWETQLTWTPAEVRAILDGGPMAANKYAIKRVPRSPDSPLRALVGEHFGYRQRLLDAAQAVGDIR